MPLNLPTDPVEIQAEIAALLQTTPETTDRGRLFHLFNALNANNKGGAGLPMSVAVVEGLKSWDDRTRDRTDAASVLSYIESYFRRDSRGSYDRYGTSSTQPYFYYGGDQAVLGQVGVPKSLAGKTNVDVTVEGVLGHIPFTKEFSLAKESGHTSAAAVLGLTSDYSSRFPHIFTWAKKSNTVVSLQLYQCNLDTGDLEKVGTVQDVSFSLGTLSSSSLRVTAAFIGDSGYMALHLHGFQSGALKETLITLDTSDATKAADVFVDRDLTNGIGYPSITPLYSYDADDYGFVISGDRPTGVEASYTCYQLNTSTGAATKGSGTYELNIAAGTELNPTLNCTFALSDSGDPIHVVLASGSMLDDTAIPYAVIDVTANTITQKTVDLSAYADEYETVTPFLMPESDKYIASTNRFYFGLQHKTHNHATLLHSKSLVPTVQIPTWHLPSATGVYNRVALSPIGVALDDYVVVINGGASLSYGMGLEPWLGEYTVNPDINTFDDPKHLDTYENIVGVAGAAQPNRVPTTVKENFGSSRRVLPNVSTYLEHGAGWQPLMIPNDAEVGTIWTIRYLTSAIVEGWEQIGYPVCAAVLAERTDKTNLWFMPVATPVGVYSPFRNDLCTVTIIKTGTDEYSVTTNV